MNCKNVGKVVCLVLACMFGWVAQVGGAVKYSELSEKDKAWAKDHFQANDGVTYSASVKNSVTVKCNVKIVLDVSGSVKSDKSEVTLVKDGRLADVESRKVTFTFDSPFVGKVKIDDFGGGRELVAVQLEDEENGTIAYGGNEKYKQQLAGLFENQEKNFATGAGVGVSVNVGEKIFATFNVIKEDGSALYNQGEWVGSLAGGNALTANISFDAE